MKNAQETISVNEKGRSKEGKPLFSEQRLFVQLFAFGNCHDEQALIKALQSSDVDGVLYRDINDPYGVAILVFNKNPEIFITKIRALLKQEPFNKLTLKPEFTMLGRTYSIGYESDLSFVLFDRPISRLLNPELSWVIWYPLRRKGEFECLSPETQMDILKEHGAIGIAYGSLDLAHDVRLACHGLDKNDNDFIIGLLGKELHPLSAVVQRMRKTQQTSQYLERLGPFFIGKVLWQSQQRDNDRE